MEFESIRPVISGVAGGLIATWLIGRWARRLPSSYGEISREELLARHRVAVYLANGLFLLGLFAGIALYPLGGFASTDWRPFGIGYGLASVLPLIALGLVSALSGRSARAAYVAFAWGQGTPISMTYGILGAGVVVFVWALASLAT